MFIPSSFDATLLDKYALPLCDAGLRRVNISLDTLNAQRRQ